MRQGKQAPALRTLFVSFTSLRCLVRPVDVGAVEAGDVAGDETRDVAGVETGVSGNMPPAGGEDGLKSRTDAL